MPYTELKNDLYNESYGSFNCTNKQIVFSNESIIYENYKNISNLYLSNNSDYIKIYKSGIYTIHLVCQLESPSLLGLYINNNLEKSIITINNNLIIMHEIIKLKKNDKIYFKNISNNNLITLSLPSILNMQIHNIELIIYKITSDFDNELSDSDSTI